MEEEVTISMSAQQIAAASPFFMACGQLIEQSAGMSKLEALTIIGYFVGAGFAALGVNVDVNAPAGVAFPSVADGYMKERAARVGATSRAH